MRAAAQAERAGFHIRRSDPERGAGRAAEGYAMIDDPEILAEPVKPEAAIEFWKQRAKLTWEEAKGLADGAKARAFYVTGLYRQDLVNLVSDALQKALEDGETLEDFKKRIADAITKQGWKDYRVETIFRANMQSAYAAGRYRKMRAVKQSRPYWQYLAIMDKRTRPSHAILHGKVYPADHEFWQTNYPPNGFRCRCGVATLSERQVKAQNLTVEKDMPQADMWTDPKTGMEYFVNFPGADKGFRNNPYEDWAKNGGIDDLPGLKDFGKSKRTRAKKPAPKPDIYEQAFGIKKQAPVPMAQAAKLANPNYARNTPYAVNCQRCVPTYELLRRGYMVEALPKPATGNTIINSMGAFKNPAVRGKRWNSNHPLLDKKALVNELMALPDGARAGIGWGWPGGGGHTIACEKVNGQLVFVDPQIGLIGPSALGNANSAGYSWFRMDNLDIKPNLLTDIAKPSGKKP